MDDIRKSFSKLKKDFKHRIGSKKPDRAGANTAGEGVGSSASLLQPNLRTAVSGHDGGGSRVSADVSRVHSRNPSPHPEFVPADEGHDNPHGKEVGVDKKKGSRSRSRLGPDIQGAAGSSPASDTPIPPIRGPDSTWTLSPQLLCLITHLGDAAPDRMPQNLRPEEGDEPGAAANENKSSWKSTAFATAKFLLRGVRDASDAFGPLKSVAGGLCFILENCEVWLSPAYTVTNLTGAPENEGERRNDRIVGPEGEGACRITPFTDFRRRCQGAKEEKDPRTVSSLSVS